jgi:hypothetical protein
MFEARVVEFIQRRGRQLILDLSGKIQFDAEWDYKKMRRRIPPRQAAGLATGADRFDGAGSGKRMRRRYCPV